MRTLLVLVVVYASVAFAKGWTGRAWDCQVFVTAGERFLAGEPLYRASDGQMPFKYAPPVAALFAPLALLPMQAACAVWGLLSALFLFLAARKWMAWLAIDNVGLASLVCISSFYMEAFLGQSDLFVFWLMTEALFNRGLRGGIALAVVAAVKPPALVLALPLLFLRPRWLPYFTGVLVALGAGALVCLGRFQEFSAWRDLVASSTPPFFLRMHAQGFLQLVFDVLGPVSDMRQTLLPQLALTGVCAGILLAMRRDLRVMSAAALVCAAALSPLAWRANYLLAWPAWLILSAWRPRWAFFSLAVPFSLVQLALIDDMLSEANVQRVLNARPFAWVHLVVLLMLVLYARRAPVPDLH